MCHKYFLIATLTKTAKLVRSIELKLSGSSKGWIVKLYTKYQYDMTPMADFTGQ